MIAAERPTNERSRIKALRSCCLLDTEAESSFDALTRLAASIAQTPIALVSLVDSDRQWFKSRYGMAATETPRDVAFCAHTILQPEPFIVEDASVDDRFSDNPLVCSQEGIRFYAGFPLRTSTAHAVGTLCVIDRVPRQLTTEQLDVLALLARQVEAQVELRRSHHEEQDARVATTELLNELDRKIRVTLDGIVNAQRLLDTAQLTAEQKSGLHFMRDATDSLGTLLDLLQLQLEMSRPAIQNNLAVAE